MLYFDTSFLVPLILPERTSDAVTAFFGGLPGRSLAVSHWTRVEFSSLIAREVRMGGLDSQAAAQADHQFERTIATFFTVLVPGIEDFELAKRYLGCFETGLRAGDALHLAIAANCGAQQTYSLDNQLVKAGALLGLPVARGIDAD